VSESEVIGARELVEPAAKVSKTLEEAWKAAERVRKVRMRRYAVAAGFIAFGFFSMAISLMLLMERLSLLFLGVNGSYLLLTTLGSVSFGYGFYRMGTY